MKKERVIGGEFEISIDNVFRETSEEINFDRGLLANYSVVYSSGRCALYAVLKKISKDSSSIRILLPDYLCESVVNSVVKSGIEYDFYHIQSDFSVDNEKLLEAVKYGGAILFINYFGMVSYDETIELIREKYPNTIIIVDDVQNFYGLKNESKCDYAFTSFRKWFPVPDGATVKNNRGGELPIYDEVNRYSSYKLAAGILKDHRSIIDDNVYLDLFRKGEEIIDEDFLGRSCDYTAAVMNSIDLEKLANKRRENALILHDGLTRLGIDHLWRNTDKTVPFCIPVFIRKHRDEIRKKLFEGNAFCPVHWPKISGLTSMEIDNELYDTELSLICDQRYNSEDMLIQLEILERECAYFR